MKRRKKSADPRPPGPGSLPRREFALEIALLALAGAAVTVSACGGGGYSSPSSPTPGQSPTPGSATDELGDISSNHLHQALITGAQLTAGGGVTLDIRGQASHPHSVNVPADAVRDIREGRKVELRSTVSDGHEHVVTFNAEIPSPPTRY